MTDIGVTTTSYQVEDRSWYLGTQAIPGWTIGGTLDVSAFTAATHYPNGFLRSGIVLGRITATGLYGPYADAAADGRQTAAGILFSSVRVPNVADTTKDVGGAILVAFAPVSLARLLAIVANGATGGGFIDAAGQTDLRNIHFAA
jgi:hypothetical protein